MRSRTVWVDAQEVSRPAEISRVSNFERLTSSASNPLCYSRNLNAGAWTQYFVTLKDDEECAASKSLLDRYSNRRPRQQQHWSRKFLERTITIRNTKTGDVVD